MSNKSNTFHVTFGTSKQIIEVESNEDIVDAIYESFDIEGAVDLKYFNKDFDDWVDVKELTDIPPMSRLQVTSASMFHKYVVLL